MPEHIVAVAGTGTDVGKTWVTAGLARLLRQRGLVVAARKPAQSFDADQPIEERDSFILAAATGEHPNEVCPPHYNYPLPMAPPMAATALGLPPISIHALHETLRWHPNTDIGFVETAGGVRSPIAHDGDNIDLINTIQPNLVLLVADAGLGTINLVRLSVQALHPHNVVVILNRFAPSDDLHQRNLKWITDNDGLTVCTSIEALAAHLPTLP